MIENLNLNKLNQDEIYIQITNLTPYIENKNNENNFNYYDNDDNNNNNNNNNDDEENLNNSEIILKKETFFQQNTNINRFYFDQPLANTDITLSKKKRTIITVNNYFPYLTSRLPILNESILEISPIECAIEIIEERNELLLHAINHIDLSTLQQHLQGSVKGKYLFFNYLLKKLE
jgi:hypothetical protein